MSKWGILRTWYGQYRILLLFPIILLVTTICFIKQPVDGSPILITNDGSFTDISYDDSLPPSYTHLRNYHDPQHHPRFTPLNGEPYCHLPYLNPRSKETIALSSSHITLVCTDDDDLCEEKIVARDKTYLTIICPAGQIKQSSHRWFQCIDGKWDTALEELLIANNHQLPSFCFNPCEDQPTPQHGAAVYNPHLCTRTLLQPNETPHDRDGIAQSPMNNDSGEDDVNPPKWWTYIDPSPPSMVASMSTLTCSGNNITNVQHTPFAGYFTHTQTDIDEPIPHLCIQPTMSFPQYVTQQYLRRRISPYEAQRVAMTSPSQFHTPQPFLTPLHDVIGFDLVFTITNNINTWNNVESNLYPGITTSFSYPPIIIRQSQQYQLQSLYSSPLSTTLSQLIAQHSTLQEVTPIELLTFLMTSLPFSTTLFMSAIQQFSPQRKPTRSFPLDGHLQWQPFTRFPSYDEQFHPDHIRDNPETVGIKDDPLVFMHPFYAEQILHSIHRAKLNDDKYYEQNGRQHPLYGALSSNPTAYGSFELCQFIFSSETIQILGGTPSNSARILEDYVKSPQHKLDLLDIASNILQLLHQLTDHADTDHSQSTASTPEDIMQKIEGLVATILHDRSMQTFPHDMNGGPFCYWADTTSSPDHGSGENPSQPHTEATTMTLRVELGYNTILNDTDTLQLNTTNIQSFYKDSSVFITPLCDEDDGDSADGDGKGDGNDSNPTNCETTHTIKVRTSNDTYPPFMTPQDTNMMHSHENFTATPTILATLDAPSTFEQTIGIISPAWKLPSEQQQSSMNGSTAAKGNKNNNNNNKDSSPVYPFQPQYLLQPFYVTLDTTYLLDRNQLYTVEWAMEASTDLGEQYGSIHKHFGFLFKQFLSSLINVKPGDQIDVGQFYGSPIRLPKQGDDYNPSQLQWVNGPSILELPMDTTMLFFPNTEYSLHVRVTLDDESRNDNEEPIVISTSVRFQIPTIQQIQEYFTTIHASPRLIQPYPLFTSPHPLTGLTTPHLSPKQDEGETGSTSAFQYAFTIMNPQNSLFDANPSISTPIVQFLLDHPCLTTLGLPMYNSSQMYPLYDRMEEYLELDTTNQLSPLYQMFLIDHHTQWFPHLAYLSSYSIHRKTTVLSRHQITYTKIMRLIWEPIQSLHSSPPNSTVPPIQAESQSWTTIPLPQLHTYTYYYLQVSHDFFHHTLANRHLLYTTKQIRDALVKDNQLIWVYKYDDNTSGSNSSGLPIVSFSHYLFFTLKPVQFQLSLPTTIIPSSSSNLILDLSTVYIHQRYSTYRSMRVYFLISCFYITDKTSSPINLAQLHDGDSPTEMEDGEPWDYDQYYSSDKYDAQNCWLFPQNSITTVRSTLNDHLPFNGGNNANDLLQPNAEFIYHHTNLIAINGGDIPYLYAVTGEVIKLDIDSLLDLTRKHIHRIYFDISVVVGDLFIHSIRRAMNIQPPPFTLGMFYLGSSSPVTNPPRPSINSHTQSQRSLVETSPAFPLSSEIRFLSHIIDMKTIDDVDNDTEHDPFYSYDWLLHSSTFPQQIQSSDSSNVIRDNERYIPPMSIASRAVSSVPITSSDANRNVPQPSLSQHVPHQLHREPYTILPIPNPFTALLRIPPTTFTSDIQFTMETCIFPISLSPLQQEIWNRINFDFEQIYTPSPLYTYEMDIVHNGYPHMQLTLFNWKGTPTSVVLFPRPLWCSMYSFRVMDSNQLDVCVVKPPTFEVSPSGRIYPGLWRIDAECDGYYDDVQGSQMIEWVISPIVPHNTDPEFPLQYREYIFGVSTSTQPASVVVPPGEYLIQAKSPSTNSIFFSQRVSMYMVDCDSCLFVALEYYSKQIDDYTTFMLDKGSELTPYLQYLFPLPLSNPTPLIVTGTNEHLVKLTHLYSLTMLAILHTETIFRHNDVQTRPSQFIPRITASRTEQLSSLIRVNGFIFTYATMVKASLTADSFTTQQQQQQQQSQQWQSMVNLNNLSHPSLDHHPTEIVTMASMGDYPVSTHRWSYGWTYQPSQQIHSPQMLQLYSSLFSLPFLLSHDVRESVVLHWFTQQYASFFHNPQYARPDKFPETSDDPSHPTRRQYVDRLNIFLTKWINSFDDHLSYFTDPRQPQPNMLNNVVPLPTINEYLYVLKVVELKNLLATYIISERIAVESLLAHTSPSSSLPSSHAVVNMYNPIFPRHAKNMFPNLSTTGDEYIPLSQFTPSTATFSSTHLNMDIFHQAIPKFISYALYPEKRDPHYLTFSRSISLAILPSMAILRWDSPIFVRVSIPVIYVNYDDFVLRRGWNSTHNRSSEDIPSEYFSLISIIYTLSGYDSWYGGEWFKILSRLTKLGDLMDNNGPPVSNLTLNYCRVKSRSDTNNSGHDHNDNIDNDIINHNNVGNEKRFTTPGINDGGGNNNTNSPFTIPISDTLSQAITSGCVSLIQSGRTPPNANRITLDPRNDRQHNSVLDNVNYIDLFRQYSTPFGYGVIQLIPNMNIITSRPFYTINSVYVFSKPARKMYRVLTDPSTSLQSQNPSFTVNGFFSRLPWNGNPTVATDTTDLLNASSFYTPNLECRMIQSPTASTPGVESKSKCIILGLTPRYFFVFASHSALISVITTPPMTPLFVYLIYVPFVFVVLAILFIIMFIQRDYQITKHALIYAAMRWQYGDLQSHSYPYLSFIYGQSYAKKIALADSKICQSFTTIQPSAGLGQHSGPECTHHHHYYPGQEGPPQAGQHTEQCEPSSPIYPITPELYTQQCVECGKDVQQVYSLPFTTLFSSDAVDRLYNQLGSFIHRFHQSLLSRRHSPKGVLHGHGDSYTYTNDVSPPQKQSYRSRRQYSAHYRGTAVSPPSRGGDIDDNVVKSHRCFRCTILLALGHHHSLFRLIYPQIRTHNGVSLTLTALVWLLSLFASLALASPLIYQFNVYLATLLTTCIAGGIQVLLNRLLHLSLQHRIDANIYKYAIEVARYHVAGFSSYLYYTQTSFYQHILKQTRDRYRWLRSILPSAIRESSFAFSIFGFALIDEGDDDNDDDDDNQDDDPDNDNDDDKYENNDGEHNHSKEDSGQYDHDTIESSLTMTSYSHDQTEFTFKGSQNNNTHNENHDINTHQHPVAVRAITNISGKPPLSHDLPPKPNLKCESETSVRIRPHMTSTNHTIHPPLPQSSSSPSQATPGSAYHASVAGISPPPSHKSPPSVLRPPSSIRTTTSSGKGPLKPPSLPNTHHSGGVYNQPNATTHQKYQQGHRNRQQRRQLIQLRQQERILGLTSVSGVRDHNALRVASHLFHWDNHNHYGEQVSSFIKSSLPVNMPSHTTNRRKTKKRVRFSNDVEIQPMKYKKAHRQSSSSSSSPSSSSSSSSQSSHHKPKQIHPLHASSIGKHRHGKFNLLKHYPYKYNIQSNLEIRLIFPQYSSLLQTLMSLPPLPFSIPLLNTLYVHLYSHSKHYNKDCVCYRPTPLLSYHEQPHHHPSQHVGVRPKHAIHLDIDTFDEEVHASDLHNVKISPSWTPSSSSSSSSIFLNVATSIPSQLQYHNILHSTRSPGVYTSIYDMPSPIQGDASSPHPPCVCHGSLDPIDGTPLISRLQFLTELKKKVTLVSQRRRRALLYNSSQNQTTAMMNFNEMVHQYDGQHDNNIDDKRDDHHISNGVGGSRSTHHGYDDSDGGHSKSTITHPSQSQPIKRIESMQSPSTSKHHHTDPSPSVPTIPSSNDPTTVAASLSQLMEQYEMQLEQYNRDQQYLDSFFAELEKHDLELVKLYSELEELRSEMDRLQGILNQLEEQRITAQSSFRFQEITSTIDSYTVQYLFVNSQAQTKLTQYQQLESYVDIFKQEYNQRIQIHQQNYYLLDDLYKDYQQRYEEQENLKKDEMNRQKRQQRALLHQRMKARRQNETHVDNYLARLFGNERVGDSYTIHDSHLRSSISYHIPGMDRGHILIPPRNALQDLHASNPLMDEDDDFWIDLIEDQIYQLDVLEKSDSHHHTPAQSSHHHVTPESVNQLQLSLSLTPTPIANCIDGSSGNGSPRYQLSLSSHSGAIPQSPPYNHGTAEEPQFDTTPLPQLQTPTATQYQKIYTTPSHENPLLARQNSFVTLLTSSTPSFTRSMNTFNPPFSAHQYPGQGLGDLNNHGNGGNDGNDVDVDVDVDDGYDQKYRGSNNHNDDSSFNNNNHGNDDDDDDHDNSANKPHASPPHGKHHRLNNLSTVIPTRKQVHWNNTVYVYHGRLGELTSLLESHQSMNPTRQSDTIASERDEQLLLSMSLQDSKGFPPQRDQLISHIATLSTAYRDDGSRQTNEATHSPSNAAVMTSSESHPTPHPNGALLHDDMALPYVKDDDHDSIHESNNSDDETSPSSKGIHNTDHSIAHKHIDHSSSKGNNDDTTESFTSYELISSIHNYHFEHSVLTATTLSTNESKSKKLPQDLHLLALLSTQYDNTSSPPMMIDSHKGHKNVSSSTTTMAGSDGQGILAKLQSLLFSKRSMSPQLEEKITAIELSELATTRTTETRMGMTKSSLTRADQYPLHSRSQYYQDMLAKAKKANLSDIYGDISKFISPLSSYIPLTLPTVNHHDSLINSAISHYALITAHNNVARSLPTHMHQYYGALLILNRALLLAPHALLSHFGHHYPLSPLPFNLIATSKHEKRCHIAYVQQQKELKELRNTRGVSTSLSSSQKELSHTSTSIQLPLFSQLFSHHGDDHQQSHPKLNDGFPHSQLSRVASFHNFNDIFPSLPLWVPYTIFFILLVILIFVWILGIGYVDKEVRPIQWFVVVGLAIVGDIFLVSPLLSFALQITQPVDSNLLHRYVRNCQLLFLKSYMSTLESFPTHLRIKLLEYSHTHAPSSLYHASSSSSSSSFDNDYSNDGGGSGSGGGGKLPGNGDMNYSITQSTSYHAERLVQEMVELINNSIGVQEIIQQKMDESQKRKGALHQSQSGKPSHMQQPNTHTTKQLALDGSDTSQPSPSVPLPLSIPNANKDHGQSDTPTSSSPSSSTLPSLKMVNKDDIKAISDVALCRCRCGGDDFQSLVVLTHFIYSTGNHILLSDVPNDEAIDPIHHGHSPQSSLSPSIRTHSCPVCAPITRLHAPGCPKFKGILLLFSIYLLASSQRFNAFTASILKHHLLLLISEQPVKTRHIMNTMSTHYSSSRQHDGIYVFPPSDWQATQSQVPPATPLDVSQGDRPAVRISLSPDQQTQQDASSRLLSTSTALPLSSFSPLDCTTIIASTIDTQSNLFSVRSIMKQSSKIKGFGSNSPYAKHYVHACSCDVVNQALRVVPTLLQFLISLLSQKAPLVIHPIKLCVDGKHNCKVIHHDQNTTSISNSQSLYRQYRSSSSSSRRIVHYKNRKQRTGKRVGRRPHHEILHDTTCPQLNEQQYHEFQNIMIPLDDPVRQSVDMTNHEIDMDVNELSIPSPPHVSHDNTHSRIDDSSISTTSPMRHTEPEPAQPVSSLQHIEEIPPSSHDQQQYGMKRITPIQHHDTSTTVKGRQDVKLPYTPLPPFSPSLPPPTTEHTLDVSNSSHTTQSSLFLSLNDGKQMVRDGSRYSTAPNDQHLSHPHLTDPSTTMFQSFGATITQPNPPPAHPPHQLSIPQLSTQTRPPPLAGYTSYHGVLRPAQPTALMQLNARPVQSSMSPSQDDQDPRPNAIKFSSSSSSIDASVSNSLESLESLNEPRQILFL